MFFCSRKGKVHITEYIKEIEKYNESIKTHGKLGEQTFFSEIDQKYPEFQSLCNKSFTSKSEKRLDLLQYLMENSEFLNKEDNKWMQSVMQVIRKTSIFFSASDSHQNHE
jgi:stage V sporulation protein R